MIGPKFAIEATCNNCEHGMSESYRVQSDSGMDVRCGDTRWITSIWCPFLSVAIKKLCETSLAAIPVIEDLQRKMNNPDFIRLGKLREIKKQLYKVDGPRCVYCGVKTVLVRKAKTDPWATIDHIIPRSNGGTDDIDNLVIACYNCNNTKGSEPKEIPQAVMQYLKQKSRIERISYAVVSK